MTQKITNVTIKNVKGFDETNGCFDLEIQKKCVNVLLAPNGFGKSSFAIAFQSLIKTRLAIQDKHRHEKNNSLLSSLSITVDDSDVYSATETSNDISDNFNVCVINSRLKGDSNTTKTSSFMQVTSSIAVEDIEWANLPEKLNLDLSFSKCKEDFGINSKVLKNCISSCLKDFEFLSALKNCKTYLSNLKLRKSYIDLINNINGFSNAKTADYIKTNVDKSIVFEIEKNTAYKHIIENFGVFFSSFTPIDKILSVWQIMYLLKDTRNDITKAFNYVKALKSVDNTNEMLSHFNSAKWKDKIGIINEKGVHKIKFPQADELSNGQRDVITFMSQILKFKKDYKSNKENILIIDEVFDYLDDANLIAAQYYLLKLIQDYGDNLYIIMLTHLNPLSFKGNLLTEKLINVCYLCNSVAVASKEIKAFIAFRENLDKKDPVKNDLYNEISKYFFHYHIDTDSQDLTSRITISSSRKDSLYRGCTFRESLITQLNLYLQEEEIYDPYMVCIALRRGVERMIYELLDADAKIEFLSKFKTKDKLKFAEEKLAHVPESLYIIGAIYNEAEHLKKESDEKHYVYKLNNKAIRHIIQEIFNYDNSELPIDVL